MKKIIAIIILAYPILTFGQSDGKTEPWNIGCDTMITQTEMNICSYESYKIADSILTSLYSELTDYFDSNLIIERKRIESSTDTIQIEYVKLIEQELESTKKSQKDFSQFLNSTTEIMNLQYNGGSIRPLVINTYALKLTINHIELMRIMIEEIKS